MMLLCMMVLCLLAINTTLRPATVTMHSDRILSCITDAVASYRIECYTNR